MKDRCSNRTVFCNPYVRSHTLLHILYIDDNNVAGVRLSHKNAL